MNLYQAVKHLYPELSDDDFSVKDDGNGPYILNWSSVLPQPTEEELSGIWEEVELKSAKEVKKKELSKICNQTIIGRFSADVEGVTYQFSNDMEAQSNFKDAKLSFSDGTVDMYLGGVLPWTAYDTDGNVVRLQLSNEQFQGVYIARLLHQNGAISKLRDDLEKQVNAAEEVSEVEAIQW